MKKFIGRKAEIQWLNSDYDEDLSKFVVLYGRRRVGKSLLIEKFCEGKRSFSFLAGKEKKAMQIKRFLAGLAQFAGDPLISMVAPTTWDDAFKIFSTRRNSEKTVLVLDEFQWMCEHSPELISDIQRFWDTVWKRDGKVFLILCGSSVSFMTGEVLSEKSPLFGRRTREILLEPFSASEASLFLPGRSSTEKAETLMLLGGIPMYLDLIKEKTSLRKNINVMALTKGGILINETHFILSEQLRETGTYFRLLKILATGPRSIAELAHEMRMSAGQALFYLRRLDMLKFIKKYMPITKDVGSKSIRYKLVDEYLRFYFYYIEPNMARITNNTGDYLFDRITGNSWDAYCGFSFELFCEKNIAAILKKLDIGDTLEKTGTYWQRKTSCKRGVQVDLVIECSDRTTFLIECKWSKNKVGMCVADELATKEKLYPNPRGDTIRKVIIASHGVTEQVAKDKTVSCMTLQDFF
jgi:AAA+ ATPase superfamily predicted ATPase